MTSIFTGNLHFVYLKSEDSEFLLDRRDWITDIKDFYRCSYYSGNFIFLGPLNKLKVTNGEYPVDIIKLYIIWRSVSLVFW